MTEATPPVPHKAKSLSEIFNDFAQDAVQRFPHLKGHLLVADMAERKTYLHNEINTDKTGLDPITAREFLRDHQITKQMEKNPDISSMAMRDPRRNLNVIFMNEAVPEAERGAVSREVEEHIVFVLDHELAHTALKDGFSRAQHSRDYAILLSECIADAYALIRHYQRYGVDSDSKDKYVSPAARADNFMAYGDSTHFTSFVLDAIVKRKHLIDFDNLDAKQTGDLARRFALEFMPPQRVVEDLVTDFADIRRAFSQNMSGGVKALIEKTLDPNADYHTFKFGSQWLNGFLADRKLFNGQPINLPKAYLDDAAKRLKEREAVFAKQDVLFNMPIITPPRNSFKNSFVAPRKPAFASLAA